MDGTWALAHTYLHLILNFLPKRSLSTTSIITVMLFAVVVESTAGWVKDACLRAFLRTQYVLELGQTKHCCYCKCDRGACWCIYGESETVHTFKLKGDTYIFACIFAYFSTIAASPTKWYHSQR